ncbi:MAG TPA: DUF6544 family protein, partial [Blastocatellia bacterium]|nr:DUF6544 family protein [Blastocatellia bacterium]
GLGLASWVGSARWNNRTSRLVDRLEGPPSGERQEIVAFRDLEHLPAPAARYFRCVLREGQPRIRSARIEWKGEFRTGRADDGWRPFEATEHFSARPPGFVWDASIRMAPLMNVRVRDAYVAGEAAMQAKVLSLVPVVDERGKPELNAGALHRYLAEAVWIPTALFPGAGVKWSPIDEHRALATLTDSGVTVSLEFRFNTTGEITSVFTPGRYREVNGRYESTPWEGQFRKYEERSGMLIPTEGSVEWRLQDGSFPYWRGRIVDVKYDFAWPENSA